MSNKSYVENAVFMTDYYSEDDDPIYVRFRDEYRKTLHKTPEKMTLFGYDAAALILKTASSSTSDRKQFRDALAKVDGFPGVRGPVSFKDRRENPYVHLLQFRDDRIIRIQ
jgi:ABC-type branched-subunit amino acid transport system substrate-binding protein